VIYLEAAPEVLYARIQNEMDRPLLQGWPAFEQLFLAREACYRGADVIINANSEPVQLLRELEQMLGLK
jgi:shikimate kinase